MHEDIQVSNGVWKFTGNPSLICECLSGKGCIQFPERSNDGSNPFVAEDSTKPSGKICTRIWKFQPNSAKFKIGEKVIQSVVQDNGVVMRTIGTINFIEETEFKEGILYWMTIESRSWYQNGSVIKRATYKEKISGSSFEHELEKVS